tara:strand:+ start:1187 stop:2053 length:867 start_codon:yes stop_codon:yes gene_type:complete
LGHGIKSLKMNQFDIVIAVGPNDIDYVKNQIKCTKKNIIGHRNIYLIPYDPTFEIDGCITVKEDDFPFSKQTVAQYHGKLERNGWYLQQLLKLYAGIVIPGILDRYLVIDSDTYFIKPTTFITDDNKCLYSHGRDIHEPYFDHMSKLHASLKRVNYSGICHHMMFETKYVKELFNLAESDSAPGIYRKVHSDGRPMKFYEIFLESINKEDFTLSGASEYEIYFNYMLLYYKDCMEIRYLPNVEAQFNQGDNPDPQWKKKARLKLSEDLVNSSPAECKGHNYISCHWYN